MMPTFERQQRFDRDFQKLPADLRRRFVDVVAKEFIPALKSRTFPPRLRVKRVVSTDRVWEMSWAPDGRATFEYGEEVIDGEPHVIWRRVGTHDVFATP